MISLGIILCALVLFLAGLVKKKNLYHFFMLIVLLLVCGINIAEYFPVFTKKNMLFYNIGNAICRNAQPDEMIFVKVTDDPKFTLTPDLVFYAKRNVIVLNGKTNFQDIIKKNGAKKARLMIFKGDTFDTMKTFNPQNELLCQ